MQKSFDEIVIEKQQYVREELAKILSGDSNAKHKTLDSLVYHLLETGARWRYESSQSSSSSQS